MGNNCCATDSVKANVLQISQIPKISSYKKSSWPQDDQFLLQILDQLEKSKDMTVSKIKQVLKHEKQRQWICVLWENGEPQGQGVMYLKTETDSVIYIGQFRGLPNGKGKALFKSGKQFYEGDIVDGRAEGQGTFKSIQSCYQFNGIWNQSKPIKGKLIIDQIILEIDHNQAKISYPDHKVYLGQIDHKKLLPNGYGKATFKNGSKYQGLWENGYMHGKGKLTWDDGSQYQGHYFFGSKNGFGKHIFSSGNYYQGYWSQGNRNGKGIFYFAATKIILEGQWKNDKLFKQKTEL